MDNWEIDDETLLKFCVTLEFDCNVNVDDVEFVSETPLSQHSQNYGVVSETEMNVEAIKHRPSKVVCVDSELVVHLPDEEGGSKQNTLTKKSLVSVGRRSARNN